MYAVRLWLSPLRIAQRLAKMECMFQQKEVYEPQQLFTAEKHTDFSVYINFIQENMALSAPQNNTGVMHQRSENGLKINVLTWRRFVNILNRAARAQEGVSRQERIFVQQFWAELQHFDAG